MKSEEALTGAVWLMCYIIGFSFLTLIPSCAEAQAPSHLEQALLHKMEINGGNSYVRHCRSYDGGCVRRIHDLTVVIENAADEYGLDPYVLAATAIRESGLNPNVVGQARRELTVFQINSRRSEYRSIRNLVSRFRRLPNDRERVVWRNTGMAESIGAYVAAGILKRSIDICGSVWRGLSMYNTGTCDRGYSYSRRVWRERTRLVAYENVPRENL